MSGYPVGDDKVVGASKQPWHVHKFGGTSVGDAGCFRRVQEIISEVAIKGTRPAIVVSAMGGKPKTTDMLIQLTKDAASNSWDAVESGLDAIRAKHFTCLRDLFGESTDYCTRLTQVVEKDLTEIVSLLRAVTVMRDAPESIVGIVSGYGEQWSSQFLQSLLASRNEPWVYLDARKVLVVDADMGVSSDVEINWAESSSKLEKFLQDNAGQNLVITGFIASTSTGGSTTLGRDGSDFSATVFGRLLNSIDVTIWTDVSGVMSADPRKVPDAYSLDEVSYQEAAELAFFGAKVVHPKTMVPAFARVNKPAAWGAKAQSIPIYIKNTFEPLNPGTRIFETSEATNDRNGVCCGFTTVDDLTLISIEGLGMQGNPVGSRLFPALKSAGVSVVMIAQGSSEASLSYLVYKKDTEIAKSVTLDAFAREFSTGAIQSLGVNSPCSLVAAVGDAIPFTAGVAGKLFGSLGQAGVNVMAIAQSLNARAMSAVVAGEDSNKALAALHAAFLHHVPIAIGIIGAGGVAEAFMQQIDSALNPDTGCTKELADKFGVDFRIVGVWDPPDRSEVALGSEDSRGKGLVTDIFQRLSAKDLSNLADKGTPSDVRFLVDRLKRSPYIHRVIVDCSDSKSVALNYQTWADQGLHVVSQNHIGFHAAAYESINTPSFDKQISPDGVVKLLKTVSGVTRRILRSAAIGRGLPILPTLQLLRESGDRVLRFDGIFSISLHYLCTRLCPADGSKPVSFEEAAQLSSDCGFFEKQYGLDMTGQLAKSQILLLAAELRNDMMAEVDLEPFTAAAASMANGDPNKVVRYIGSLDLTTMKGSVKPILLPVHHPFAQLSGKSRMCRFFTQKRGPDDPVAVSGPVGNKLVGSSMFADCLELARRFGAHEKAEKAINDSESKAPWIGA